MGFLLSLLECLLCLLLGVVELLLRRLESRGCLLLHLLDLLLRLLHRLLGRGFSFGGGLLDLLLRLLDSLLRGLHLLLGLLLQLLHLLLGLVGCLLRGLLGLRGNLGCFWCRLTCPCFHAVGSGDGEDFDHVVRVVGDFGRDAGPEAWRAVGGGTGCGEELRSLRKRARGNTLGG